MANVIRQSTQIVVRIGPFVDATNAVDPETGITLGAADQAEALKAAGAATADISAATWAAVTGADGWYDLTLTTSHTDTVGELAIVVQDSSVALPVFVRFQVIEEAVYDALYAASAAGPLQSTVAARTLDVSAGGEAGVDWANVGTPGSTVNLSATTANVVNTVTTLTGHTAQTGDSFARIGAPAGASLAADIAAAKVDTAAILVDTGTAGVVIGAGQTVATVTSAGLSAAAVDAIWDEDIVAAHNTADTAGAILNNILPEKNSAFSDIEFLWVAASDHVTPVTSASTTSVTRSIDGGAFGSGTGTLAEVGNGIYQYDASAADMNGTVITFRFVATGGTPGAPDDAFVTLKTSG